MRYRLYDDFEKFYETVETCFGIGYAMIGFIFFTNRKILGVDFSDGSEKILSNATREQVEKTKKLCIKHTFKESDL